VVGDVRAARGPPRPGAGRIRAPAAVARDGGGQRARAAEHGRRADGAGGRDRARRRRAHDVSWEGGQAMTVTIVNPAAEDVTERLAPAPRVTSLRGARVALIDNSKHNADRFLDTLAALLVRDHGVAKIERYRKISASVPTPPGTLHRPHALRGREDRGGGRRADCGGTFGPGRATGRRIGSASGEDETGARTRSAASARR